MLKYIQIKGFKSIKNISLDFTPVNILIGSNGSGKSNLISFFNMMHAVFNKQFQRLILEERPDNLLYFGRKQTEKLYWKLIFSTDNYNNAFWIRMAQTNTGGLFIEEEGSGFGNFDLLKNNDVELYVRRFNLEESVVQDSTSYRDVYLRDYLAKLQVYHFHDTSSTSMLRRECNLQDNLYLKPDGRNLPAFLYYLKKMHEIVYNRIEKTVQSVAPFFNHFVLEPSKINENEIEIRWVDKSDLKSNFSVYQFSDGTLRFIALTVVLLQPNPPSVIIIDEPELGLHPFAITKLAGMINSVASKGTQVIVATQSADLVNHFEAEQIITVDQVDGESQFNRLTSEELSQWLDEYSIGDLWQRNIIQGGQPK